MKRGDFIRNTIFGLAASMLPEVLRPSLPNIVEVIEEAPIVMPIISNARLISDLQLLTPQYYKSYVDKYGNEDFTGWLKHYTDEQTSIQETKESS